MINYRIYYSHPAVQYEMVKSLRNKYLSILSDTLKILFIDVHSVDDLRFYFKKYNIYKGDKNLYLTVNNYSALNRFDLRPKQRKMQYSYFTSGHCEHVKYTEHLKDKCFLSNRQSCTSRDFVIDLDIEKSKHVYSDIDFLKYLFTKGNFYFKIKSSGSGYHLVISNRYLGLKWNDVSEHKAFAENLRDEFGLSSIDTKVYGNIQQFKLPYSIDRNTDNVALPLRFNDLDVIKNFNYKHVLENIKLFDRGELLYKGSRLFNGKL